MNTNVFDDNQSNGSPFKPRRISTVGEKDVSPMSVGSSPHYNDNCDCDFNRMPRILNKNTGKQEICLPSSIAYVIKRIHKFNQKQCTFYALVTIVLRIKCAGLEDQKEVIAHLES